MHIESPSPESLRRVHIGCGLTFLEGWINCDGGPSARLFSALPRPLRSALKRSGILGRGTKTFWTFMDSHPIVYANAHEFLPFPSNSVDIIYSSHMIDCLTTTQISRFFQQAFRILKPGGEIRLAGMDLDRVVQNYVHNSDTSTLLISISYPDPKEEKLFTRLKQALFPPTIYLAHLNFSMYKMMLKKAGFESIIHLAPGETRLSHYEPINLWQRQGESIYVEARKPLH
jgi:SAM-dependent methyltransferase